MILMLNLPIWVPEHTKSSNYRSAKIKHVILAVQVFSPFSFVISMLYVQSVFPKVTAVATPVTNPEVADL